MTDIKKKTVTKAKAKPKAGKKIKPKSEAKRKKSTDEVAPFMKSNNTNDSPHDESSGQKSFTTPVLVLILAVTVLVTIYKFDDEINSHVSQAGDQESIDNAEVATSAMTQVDSDINNADTQSVLMQEQQYTPGYETVYEDSQAQAMPYNEIMQQGRQPYGNGMQPTQQQYQALREARQLERARMVEAQKEEFMRIRQNQLDTRKKVEAVHEQISALHEKLHQIMRESQGVNGR